jgi:hypothetical protein
MILAGVALDYEDPFVNSICFLGSIIVIINRYHSLKDEDSEEQFRFVVITALYTILLWVSVCYNYDSIFYEKEKKHIVVNKEIVPPGYNVHARYFLICEDTIIETYSPEYYFSINPPQILYCTTKIKRKK